MPVDMHDVTSSNVARVGHDGLTNELHVEFKNGDKWVYSDVSPEKHGALMTSGSVGAYLHAHIKPAHPARRG